MKKVIIITLLVFVVKIYAQDNHPIIGAWQLSSVVADGETQTGMKAIWIFEEGGVFKAARSINSKSTPVGTWECDKDRKVLIMKSEVDKDFNGEAKVLNLKEDQLSYKKEDAILYFTKVEMAKPDTTPIPELDFTYIDFMDKEGGDKYLEDGNKLPWTIDQIYLGLIDVKEMVYNIDHYVPNQGKTDSWTNSYKTEFISPNELSIREYSYFQKDFIEDDHVFPLDDETKGQKIFFPQEELEYFRYIGEEMVKTDLENFKCTVFEGIGENDLNFKYWMIIDKPGVFAKIIKSKIGSDFTTGYTNIYTLKSIN